MSILQMEKLEAEQGLYVQVSKVINQENSKKILNLEQMILWNHPFNYSLKCSMYC